jgi:hypothetical protein
LFFIEVFLIAIRPNGEALSQTHAVDQENGITAVKQQQSAKHHTIGMKFLVCRPRPPKKYVWAPFITNENSSQSAKEVRDKMRPGAPQSEASPSTPLWRVSCGRTEAGRIMERLRFSRSTAYRPIHAKEYS